MKNTFRSVLSVLIALFCLFSNRINAETHWCRVELIVFAQISPSNEVFEQTASRIDWPGNLLELSDPPMPLADLQQMPLPYIPLQTSDRSLTPAYETLQLQGGYSPLLHTAWVQPLDNSGINAAVHVHGGGQANAETINGWVRVENSGDPQLLADLEYSPTTAPDADKSVYRLYEKRRMPFGEVHYFDHPKFGLIALLSPLQ